MFLFSLWGYGENLLIEHFEDGKQNNYHQYESIVWVTFNYGMLEKFNGTKHLNPGDRILVNG